MMAAEKLVDYTGGKLLSKQSRPNRLQQTKKSLSVNYSTNKVKFLKWGYKTYPCGILDGFKPKNSGIQIFQLCLALTMVLVSWFMIACDWDIFKYLNWTSHPVVIYRTDLFSMEIHPLSRVTGKWRTFSNQTISHTCASKQTTTKHTTEFSPFQ